MKATSGSVWVFAILAHGVIVPALMSGFCDVRGVAAFGQTTPVASAASARGDSKMSRLTPRQQRWRDASISERVRLAEALGEQGARKMAQAKGYVPLSDGFRRTVPQGPDQVYQATDGRVIVIEAKGGSGQPGRGYGYAQGTPEWAVELANRVA